MPFRIAREDSRWVKFDPATGKVKAAPKKEESASIFATEEEAGAAKAKALSHMEAAFDACFAPGNPPHEGFDIYWRHRPWDDVPAGFPRIDPKARDLSIEGRTLRSAKVEEFEVDAPMVERMAMPPICAIVAEDGRFAKMGATGYWTFVMDFAECTVFASAEQAQATYADMCPAKDAAAAKASARVVEFKLTPSASMDPVSLAPSENSATAMMRSIREKEAIEEQAPAAKGSRKKAASL